MNATVINQSIAKSIFANIPEITLSEPRVKEYRLMYFTGVWVTSKKFACESDAEAIYNAENPTEWDNYESAARLAEKIKKAGWGVALFCGNRKVKEYAPSTFIH